jgi:hypothetical protein
LRFAPLVPPKRTPKHETVLLSKNLTILSGKDSKVNKVTGTVVCNDFFELVPIPPGFTGQTG